MSMEGVEGAGGTLNREALLLSWRQAIVYDGFC